jgi:hypothetical protein
MLKRAGDEDPEGFAVIAKLIQQACEGLPLSAELTRSRHGYSWAQLAGPMGVSRQAAQQRFHVAPDLAAERLFFAGVAQTIPPVPAPPVEDSEHWQEILSDCITLQIGVDR